MPTSRTGWLRLGWTNLVSYSCNTSLLIMFLSFCCCSNSLRISHSREEKIVIRNIVFEYVTLGLGSSGAIGRNIQYITTCAGLKRHSNFKPSGVGSHTDISQTSRPSCGCALGSAGSGMKAETAEVITESGEPLTAGDGSTRTRRAEGVCGVKSIGFSKSL